jgi:hypothetical protein
LGNGLGKTCRLKAFTHGASAEEKRGRGRPQSSAVREARRWQKKYGLTKQDTRRIACAILPPSLTVVVILFGVHCRSVDKCPI